MSSFHSLGIVVRDEVMTLFDRVQVGGSDKMVPFTERVLWLRESESTLFIRHDSNLIEEVCTYNDWQGFMTSLEATIENIYSRAKLLKIGIGDRLALEVDTKIFDRPCLEDNSAEARIAAERYAGREYRKTYRAIGSNWYTSDIPEKLEFYERFPGLENVTIFEKQGIYSTRSDPSSGCLTPFLAKWIEEQRKTAKQLSSRKVEAIS